MRNRAGRSGIGTVSRDEAETIGAQALLFFVSDETRLTGLMTATGLTPSDLKTRAGEPALSAALLEHLLAAEPLLLHFAAEHDVAPERIQPAADVLSGRTED